MMNNYTKDQVVFAVKKLFNKEEQAEVLGMLNLQENTAYRTYLAVLKLSKGNLTDFHSYLKKSEEDYRDVLWWAEYEGKEKDERIENPYKEILN